MKYENGITVWDNEFKRQHWTPDEITASHEKVARICEIIEAEHNGEISHDEAMIRHLMLDPDLADIMLDDAINDANMSKVRKVQQFIEEAKTRRRKNPPSSLYWQDITDNAEETARTGYKLNEAIAQVSKALDILRTAVTANV